MTRIFFGMCLILCLVGCELIAAVDRSKIKSDTSTNTGGSGGSTNTGGNAGGTGGTAGTGGDAGSGGNTGGAAGSGGNTGGMAGSGGSGGSTGGSGGQGGTGGSTGGSGGQGGQGGSGGGPCETGIYLTVDSYGAGGPLSANSGPINSTTFDVHGTSPGNELNVTVSIVNNLSADFTTPQSTTALQNVRLRCQDPSGIPSYIEVCNLPLTAGKADCPSPGCYSASSGIVKMQLQIDPAAAQSGQVRVGIDPNSAKVCDDQLGTPTWNISP